MDDLRTAMKVAYYNLKSKPCHFLSRLMLFIIIIKLSTISYNEVHDVMLISTCSLLSCENEAEGCTRRICVKGGKQLLVSVKFYSQCRRIRVWL